VPARPASTTRRGALTGALGLVVLTACDVDDLRPPEDSATPVPSPTPGSTGTPAPDADTALVDATALEIASVLASVDGVRRSFPRLRPQLQPLVRMHTSHLSALDSQDVSGTAAAPGTTRDAALAGVVAAEQGLQARLAVAAVEAQSGALARLLASMSASVSQHLAVLPSGPGPGRGTP
jgi:hypothetical protein